MFGKISTKKPTNTKRPKFIRPNGQRGICQLKASQQYFFRPLLLGKERSRRVKNLSPSVISHPLRYEVTGSVPHWIYHSGQTECGLNVSSTGTADHQPASIDTEVVLKVVRDLCTISELPKRQFGSREDFGTLENLQKICIIGNNALSSLLSSRIRTHASRTAAIALQFRLAAAETFQI